MCVSRDLRCGKGTFSHWRRKPLGSWQRPFIVIAVKETAPGTNVGEALTDAMSGKEKLPSPKSYSVFALTRFR
jgi:hypothetical protein